MNEDIIVGGKRSTMKISTCPAATANCFRNGTGLLSVLPKSQNICIINKTNTSGMKVRGVADINKSSIIKPKNDREEREALGNTLLRWR